MKRCTVRTYAVCACLVFLAIAFFGGACSGGARETNGTNGATDITTSGPTAPTVAAIRTALGANNPFGMVPELVLGDITLPECTTTDSQTLTYSMTGLPAWLAFDATMRALTLATGTTVVPQAANTSSEVIYTCTEEIEVSGPTTTTTTSTASVSFAVNDLDGGGVVDGREYEFGEVPLLNNTSGWTWLTPANVNLYRTAAASARKIPTGIMITTVGMNPTNAADDTSDFDGDGTSNRDEITNGTNMFVAMSAGTFADSGSNPAGGGSPKGIVAADLDNDGDLDLIVTNEEGPISNSIRPLLNNGSGTFTPGADYETADVPEGLTAADFDGDGKIDIAAANYQTPGSVSILLGNGDGTFAGQVPYNVGNDAFNVVAADFDGNGNIDLAVANSSSDNVSVLLGAGDGTFGPATNVAAGDQPQGIVFADFDIDGDLDLAVANTIATSKTVSILTNDGSGSFTKTSTLGTEDSPYSLTAADFNGDGAIDIAALNFDGAQAISLLLNNGDGSFANYTPLAFGNAKPIYIVAADLDGDGDIDLAATRSQDNNVGYLLGNGDGTFAAFQTVAVGTSPWGIVAADVNGNGKVDLVDINNGNNNLSILFNQ